MARVWCAPRATLDDSGELERGYRDSMNASQGMRIAFAAPRNLLQFGTRFGGADARPLSGARVLRPVSLREEMVEEPRAGGVDPARQVIVVVGRSPMHESDP